MSDPAELAERMLNRGDKIPGGLVHQIVRRVRELEGLIESQRLVDAVADDRCDRCGRPKPEPGTAGGRPRKFCRLCSPPRKVSRKSPNMAL